MSAVADEVKFCLQTQSNDVVLFTVTPRSTDLTTHPDSLPCKVIQTDTNFDKCTFTIGGIACDLQTTTSSDSEGASRDRCVVTLTVLPTPHVLTHGGIGVVIAPSAQQADIQQWVLVHSNKVKYVACMFVS